MITTHLFSYSVTTKEGYYETNRPLKLEELSSKACLKLLIEELHGICLGPDENDEEWPKEPEDEMPDDNDDLAGDWDGGNDFIE